jgi:molecular chaperone GrpE (heat shock protein)
MLRNCTWATMIVCGLCLTACEQKPPQGGKQGQTTTASTQPAGVVEEAKQTAQAVGEAASEKGKEALRMIRDLYVRNVQDELAKHEAHIQELQKKLEQTAAEARPELEKRIAELKGRVEAARGTLQRLSAASDDAWNELVKGLNAALGELRKALEEPGATQPASAPASGSAPARP